MEMMKIKTEIKKELNQLKQWNKMGFFEINYLRC